MVIPVVDAGHPFRRVSPELSTGLRPNGRVEILKCLK
jgi:hypothetical protein